MRGQFNSLSHISYEIRGFDFFLGYMVYLLSYSRNFGLIANYPDLNLLFHFSCLRIFLLKQFIYFSPQSYSDYSK